MALHDPQVALFGGADGPVVGRVVAQARRPLRPGGRLLIEHGDGTAGLSFVSCLTVSPMCAPGRTWRGDRGSGVGLTCRASCFWRARRGVERFVFLLVFKTRGPSVEALAISAALIAPSRTTSTPFRRSTTVERPARQLHHRPIRWRYPPSHPVNSTRHRCPPTIPAGAGGGYRPPPSPIPASTGCSGMQDRDRVGKHRRTTPATVEVSRSVSGPGQRCEPALRRPQWTRPQGMQGGAAVDEHGHR